MSLISRPSAPTSAATPLSADVKGIQIKNTSTTGMERTELPHADEDYAFERDRALTKVTPAGIQPLSPEETKQQHKGSKKILKKFATSALQFKYKAVSFPVMFSEPRSYLERGADLFSFLVGKYINEALETEDDPARRLAQITVGILAALHVDMNPKKVFNPILGETFIGRWEDGSVVFAEQTSHHPPISDFQLFGADGAWKCRAHCNFEITSGMSEIDVIQHGVFYLELRDGSRYEWEFPSVTISGFIKGERTVKVKGELVVTDPVNALQAVVEFEPKKDKKKGITESKATTIYGGIGPAKETKKGWELEKKDFDMEITGDYCKEILVDGEMMFDIENDVVRRALGEVSEQDLLPSDARFRLDRCFLIRGDNESADQAKTALEDCQRREAKLRKGKSKDGKKHKHKHKKGSASQSDSKSETSDATKSEGTSQDAYSSDYSD